MQKNIFKYLLYILLLLSSLNSESLLGDSEGGESQGVISKIIETNENKSEEYEKSKTQIGLIISEVKGDITYELSEIAKHILKKVEHHEYNK